MNKFKGFFFGAKAISRKDKDGDKPLNENAASGIRKCLFFLEQNHPNEGFSSLRREVEEEIAATVDLTEKGTISDGFLQSLESLYSIPLAIQRILKTHQPVIAYDAYEHFVSIELDALDEYLATTLVPFHHELFKLLMNNLANYPKPIEDVYQLFGKYMIRSNSNDIEDGKKRFIDLLEKKYRSQQAAPAAVSTPPTGFVSIQDRSVKITFTNKDQKPEEKTLHAIMSKYGNILNVSYYKPTDYD